MFPGQEYRQSSLKLMKQGAAVFEEVVEVAIDGGRKVSIEFSADGRYLALLLRQPYALRIYEMPKNEKGAYDIDIFLKGIDNNQGLQAPAYK